MFDKPTNPEGSLMPDLKLRGHHYVLSLLGHRCEAPDPLVGRPVGETLGRSYRRVYRWEGAGLVEYIPRSYRINGTIRSFIFETWQCGYWEDRYAHDRPLEGFLLPVDEYSKCVLDPPSKELVDYIGKQVHRRLLDTPTNALPYVRFEKLWASDLVSKGVLPSPSQTSAA